MAAKVRFRNGAWWVVTHSHGKRRMKRIGPTIDDKRTARAIADRINAALVLNQYDLRDAVEDVYPFEPFATAWLRGQIMIPRERGMSGHVAPNTARSYEMHLRVHLIPYFGSDDVRRIDAGAVQRFHDHCIEIGKPRSARSIEMALAILRLVLYHARAVGLLESNAVESWKRGKGRRRTRSQRVLNAENVLSFQELHDLLIEAHRGAPEYYPLILLLADTGARFGEATALRWIDIDLARAAARISRSYSSGRSLGPTKTGRERSIELSRRICTVLAQRRPDLVHDDTLVFPNRAGAFIDPGNFRERIWGRLVRRVFGRSRRITPHGLRHTFASLHMARGTNLKWLQHQGGWSSAKVLLDTYGHFMPTETTGYADILAEAPDGTGRHSHEQPKGAGPTERPKKRAPKRTWVVAQGRIELPTRGFSVRCSTN